MAFMFTVSILPFILPSPHLIMEMIFRDWIDKVCPLVSFSKVEGPAKAPTYLKWGCTFPPPYPDKMYLGLRKKRLGLETGSNRSWFLPVPQDQTLDSCWEWGIVALSSLIWRKKKIRVWESPTTFKGICCQQDDNKDVTSRDQSGASGAWTANGTSKPDHLWECKVQKDRDPYFSHSWILNTAKILHM